MHKNATALMIAMLGYSEINIEVSDISIGTIRSNNYSIRNRLATELVTLKVCNIKLSFDIWLVLYMYFILYS